MGKSTKQNVLARSVILAILGACLLCDHCTGVLLDHGPSDPNLIWPKWYRDNSGEKIPLGLCTSTATSANGPLCFPLTRSPVPPSFAGNVGDEIFYYNMQTNIQSGDIDLRYIAALEAAYGTLDPAGAAVKGNEVVFSRIRFVMSITPAARCEGQYTIIHPYGINIFPGVPTGKRALVATFDKPLGVIGDFDSVLDQGDVGPYLKWDTEFPVTSGNEKFIGDPNLAHTYTGSPFGTNFVEIQGPAGCNLDGLGNNVVRSTQGLLLGQIWTEPIPTPTTIVSAVYSRQGANNVVDVEAKAAAGNQLLLAGGEPFPSTLMVEDKKADGSGTGKFHAHVEYNGDLSTAVRVVNLASNPIISAEAGLADIVEITKAEFNPNTNSLCVDARTSDESGGAAAPTLILQQPFGGQLPKSTPGCPAGFLCACFSLPNAGSQVTSQSTPVTVVSSKGGKAIANVKYLTGKPDNKPIPPTLLAVSDSFNVSSGAPTTINVGANDKFDPSSTFRVIQQPAQGTVSVATPLGNLQYTPPSSVQPATYSFSYIIQQAGDVYSNVASVSVTLQDTVIPPITSPDVYAVRAGTTKTLDILANDKPVPGTTIDKASIKVDTTGTRGRVVVNTAGTVTYTAPAAAGVDFFKYTVGSTPVSGASASTTVSISVPASAEVVTINRPRNRANSGRWVIVASSNVQGWTSTVTGAGGSVNLNPLLTCYLRSGNDWKFIGSSAFTTIPAPFSSTATIDVVAGSVVTLPDGKDGTVPACGARKGDQCSIQCATSFVVSPYPSTNPGGQDRPSATVTMD